MQELPMDETIEIDADRFISLSYDRVWPKYVCAWSVRRKLGESDFPIAGGSRDILPPKGGEPDQVWERLREEALAEAQAAVASGSPAPEKKGLLGRLLR